jgi:hypothetical protein
MALLSRKGPFNRGPFTGSAAPTSTPSIGILAPIDPVSWKPKYQGGALDLVVNVALLAISAGISQPIVREAYTVNQPWKKAVQVEQSVNIAARVSASRIIVNPEPVFTKRWAAQLDISPNVAVRQPMLRIANQPETQTFKRAWTQVEHSPNLAANVTITVSPVNAPIEPVYYKNRVEPPELSPNIAADVGIYIAPVVRQPIYTTYKARVPPQIDSVVNVAVRVSIAQSPIEAWPEPTYYERQVQPPDHHRNAAALTPVVVAPFGALIDPSFYDRQTQNPEHIRNVAAIATVAVPPPFNALNEPALTKKLTTAPDVFPNIAANVGTYDAPIVRQPVYTSYKPQAKSQVDNYVNVAVRAVAAVAQPTQPIFVEPIYYKVRWQQPILFPNVVVTAFAGTFNVSSSDDIVARRWPQIDLSPNIAISFVAAARVIPAPIEPTLRKIAFQQPDHQRNIAVLAPPIELPQFTPIDPLIAKRYPPQVEIFQNSAIYAPAPIQQQLQYPVEPTYSIRHAPQLEIFPNLAVFLDPNPCHCVFPDAADVRVGVVYGPTGIEYTGTLTVGGSSYMRRR